MPDDGRDLDPTPKRRPAGPLLLLAASWVLVAVYYVGLIPVMYSIDYTRNIPFSEALVEAVSHSPSDLLNDRSTAAGMLFIVLSLAASLQFVLDRRTGWKVALATVAVLLPLLGVAQVPTRYVLLPLISPAVVGALLGMCDGETWSEGFVAMGALGAWMILWAVVLLVLFVRLYRRRRNRVGFAVLVGPDATVNRDHAPPGGR